MTGPRSALIAGDASAPDADPDSVERFRPTTGHHEGTDGNVQAAHVEALASAIGRGPDPEGE